MKSNLWSSAAVNGFLLSLVTIIITLFLTAFPLGTVAGLLVGIGKLVATVGLLYYFMKGFGEEQERYTYNTAFTYGFLVSFCSNIVISCYLWLHYTIIFPDSIEKTIQATQQIVSQYNLDQTAMDMIMKNFPVLMSIGPLIVYSILGLIFSAILASFAKKAELPFEGEIEE